MAAGRDESCEDLDLMEAEGAAENCGFSGWSKSEEAAELAERCGSRGDLDREGAGGAGER